MSRKLLLYCDGGLTLPDMNYSNSISLNKWILKIGIFNPHTYNSPPFFVLSQILQRSYVENITMRAREKIQLLALFLSTYTQLYNTDPSGNFSYTQHDFICMYHDIHEKSTPLSQCREISRLRQAGKILNNTSHQQRIVLTYSLPCPSPAISRVFCQ